MFINYAEFKTAVVIGGTYQKDCAATDVDDMYWDKYGVWAEFDDIRTLIPWDNVKFTTYKLKV